MTKYSKYINGKEARDKLISGAKDVYDLVSITLGPRGRNVVVSKHYDTEMLHDGVRIAQEVIPKDPFKNAGASILKEAAQQTVTSVGDGTTATVIIGYAIAKEALKIVESGINPMSLKAGLEKGRDILIDQINSQSKSVTTRKQKIQVATIASEDRELGKLIGETLHKTGIDGVVTVNDVAGPDTFIEHQEGLQIDSGYISNYFVTNPRTMTATVIKPHILVTDHKLTDVYDIIPMLKNVVEDNDQKNLVIIAQDIEGSVMATLIQNKMKGQMNTLAVKVPQFMNKDVLQDIATVVGAKFISSEAKTPIKEVTIEDLGTANECRASNEATVILGGGGDKKQIRDRVKALRVQVDDEENEFNREKLQSRLAKLIGGVYVVNVGGHTEVETRERKERAIDSVKATQAAIKGGVVPGGETIFLNLVLEAESEDEEYAFRILNKAIKEPFNKLVENAGLNSGEMMAKIGDKGVDVKTGEIVDLYEKGIIDPALVAKEAIENGVSVATALITSDAIVVEKKSEKMPKV